MKNLFNKLLNRKQEIEIPTPEKWPNFNNIVEWMDHKVSYYEQKYPNEMDRLFNPSSGDYIPQLVHVGTSNERFKENIAHYRAIKEKYPEAVLKAKAEFLHYAYYRDGDPLDYPKDF